MIFVFHVFGYYLFSFTIVTLTSPLIHQVQSKPLVDIDYEKINNEIEKIIDSFRIPTSWYDFKNQWNKATDNAEKLSQTVSTNVYQFVNKLSETNFYFDKSNYIIHYFDVIDMKLSDIQRIYRLYSQSVDMNTNYTSLLFVKSYHPYPKIASDNIQSIQDLLPDKNYIIYDYESLDKYFPSSFVESIKFDNAWMMESLVALWHQQEFSNSWIDSCRSNTENQCHSKPDGTLWSDVFEKYLSHFTGTTTKTFYWLIQNHIEWVASLPRILQILDNSGNSDVLGFGICDNVPRQINNSISEESLLKTVMKSIWTSSSNNSSSTNCSDYHPSILRFSDEALIGIIDTITNNKFTNARNQTLSSFVSKNYNLTSSDITEYGLSNNLLGKDFSNVMNNSEIKECEIEIFNDYRSNQQRFASFDSDGFYSLGGILYFSLGNCSEIYR